MKVEYLIEGSDHRMLPITAWIPTYPRMILHILHGMTEHMGRYEILAQKLNQEGILVAGMDLRGHGKSSKDANCAVMTIKDWDATLKDIQILNEDLRKRYENLPLSMMGFSLGSFLLRDYLAKGEDDIERAIIMGTGDQSSLVLGLLKKTVMGQVKKAGEERCTPLVRKLSFETYNKKFVPNHTPVDWLCSDEVERDLYQNDRLCKKEISSGMFYNLVSSMQRTGEKSTYDKWNKEMPVLLISGEEDPVGNEGRGVELVEKKMKAAGMKHVKLCIISQARHDVLHESESGADKVTIGMIKQFLQEEG